jgi:AraC-like DNA-binding protein
VVIINTWASEFTLTTGVLSQLLKYLKHLGVDADAVLRSAGADASLLLLPDARISAETYIKIEEEAVKASGDPYFGIHMGEYAEAGNWSIIGYMMMNCATLGEALLKAGKHSRIISTLIHASAFFKGRNIKITFSKDRRCPELSRHCFEAAISSSVRMARELCKTTVDPVEVGFTSSQPESPEEYRRIFRCPVLFNQKSCYIMLPAFALKLPVSCPNAGLLEYFEEYVRNYIAEIDCNKPFSAEVTKRVVSGLDSSRLSVGRVSREMGVSTRTLQSRLKDEDTSFRNILENTRITLAKKYLKENHTVEDITFMLGFREASVFRRTFKKWTGITPGEYRQSAHSLKNV